MLSEIKPVLFRYRRYNWEVIFDANKYSICKFSNYNEAMRLDSSGNLGIGGYGIINSQETATQKIARSLETHVLYSNDGAQRLKRIFTSLQEIEDNFGVSNYSGFIAQEVGPAYKFHKPEPSQWQCKLFGCDTSMVLHPSHDNVPNWFWRKMQYLILGNEWIKNES